jgi:hypothetical protein
VRNLQASADSCGKIVTMSRQKGKHAPATTGGSASAAANAKAVALRCLMLVPRGHAAPADLLDGLTRRGVSVREVTDSPVVMVTLARQSHGMLVVIEPAAWSDLPHLIAAVRRYHPSVAVWRYRHDGQPRLDRMPGYRDTAAAVVATVPTQAPRPSPAPASAPIAVLNSTPVLPMTRTPSQREVEVDMKIVLTKEELEMLLGEFPETSRDEPASH